ncbi:MAG TPA: DUF4157 domain-containing protein [Acidimicrobiales bacterium]|nr:DUF4157 domain-containing protein [Acidimicrobiales bacterium]
MGSAIPEMPLTLTVAFEEVLPSRRRPSPVLIESLGHAIDPAGPVGLVEGAVLTTLGRAPAAVPAPVRHSGSEMPVVAVDHPDAEPSDPLVFDPPARRPLPRRPATEVATERPSADPATPPPAPTTTVVNGPAPVDAPPVVAAPAAPTMIRAEPPADQLVTELSVARLPSRGGPPHPSPEQPSPGTATPSTPPALRPVDAPVPPVPAPQMARPADRPAAVAPPLGQTEERQPGSEPAVTPAPAVRPEGPDSGDTAPLDLAVPPVRSLGEPPDPAAGQASPAATPLLGGRPIASSEPRPSTPSRQATTADPAQAAAPPQPEARRSRSGLGAPIAAVPSSAITPEELLGPAAPGAAGPKVPLSGGQPTGAAVAGGVGPANQVALPLAGARPAPEAAITGHRVGQPWRRPEAAGEEAIRPDEVTERLASGERRQDLRGQPLAVVAIEPLVERTVRLAETALSRPRRTVPLLGQERRPPLPAPAPADHETVPVRAAVSAQVGVDLSSVPVDRGVETVAQSRRLAAQAYTDDSGVHIPPTVGRLDRSPGRELLAHELTHAAQRIVMGSVPDERSPAGRRLEAQADSVAERLAQLPAVTPSSPPRPRAGVPGAGGPGPAPTALPSPPAVTVLAAAPAITPPALTPTAPAAPRLTELAERAGPGEAPTAPPQRRSEPPQARPSGPEESPRPVAVSPALAGLERRLAQLEETASAALAATDTAPAAVGLASATWQSPLAVSAPAPAAPAVAPPAVPAAPAAVSNGVQRKPTADGSPWSVKPTNADLERMARLLYPVLRLELVSELREDRDRAGRLSDIYGRW